MRELHNVVVAITRPRAQSEDMVERIIAYGGIPRIDPLLAITLLSPPDGIRNHNPLHDDQTVLLFTSANGVRSAVQSGVLWMRGLNAVCVGDRTADVARRFGFTVVATPRMSRWEEIPHVFAERQWTKQVHVIWPRGQLADRDLVVALEAVHCRVTDYTAYETRSDGDVAMRLTKAMAAGRVDVVTFASGSAVDTLAAAIAKEAPDAWLHSTIAALGPKTVTHLQNIGVRAAVVGSDRTGVSLIDAIADYYRNGVER